jgi:hypothetical protein
MKRKTRVQTKLNTKVKIKAAPKKLSIYEEFIEKSKAAPVVKQLKMVRPEDLNPKQREIFDEVELHTRSKYQPPLRMLINGVGTCNPHFPHNITSAPMRNFEVAQHLMLQSLGGTGKSHINALRLMFEAKKIGYRIYSFTGSSAFQIGTKKL